MDPQNNFPPNFNQPNVPQAGDPLPQNLTSVQPPMPHTSPKQVWPKLVLSIIGLLIIACGAYAFLTYNQLAISNVPVNTEQKNSIETTNSNQVSPPSGLLSYSNKVFTNFFPKGWTTEEEVLSSYGCNAQVYFVQNSVPKQTLINESTDYLHYLKNPGSVISVSGGIGEQGTVSFEDLKKPLSDMEKDSRTIKLSFFQEDVVVTNQKLDINNSTPSLTYYFEFPKHNKEGIAKSIIIGGKFPQMISIYYIAPEKDFSEDIFNSIVSSVKNNLTTNRCDPFETSNVKKEQGITVKLPADKSWKENNTYTVSWSTDLPSSFFSYFYVQLGSDIPKRVASNPGSYGLWKVDKTKNNFEIKLNGNLTNEQISNSQDGNFDQIKNSFFVRVTAYDDRGTPYNQDDKVVATGDSPLFSVESFTVTTPIVNPLANPQNEGATVRQKGNEAALKANMAGLRLEAEKVFDTSGNSYENLCKNGVLNENTANVGYYVKGIITAQNTSVQSFPQIKCYSSKESYAIFALGQPPQTFEVVPLCSDSTGYSGKGEIDQTNLKCKTK